LIRALGIELLALLDTLPTPDHVDGQSWLMQRPATGQRPSFWPPASGRNT